MSNRRARPADEKVIDIKKSASEARDFNQKALEMQKMYLIDRNVQKRFDNGPSDGAKPGASNAVPEDPWETLAAEGRIVEPPFDLFVLSQLREQSSELGQCVDAMVANIDQLGHRQLPRLKLSDDPEILAELDKELLKQIKQEKVYLQNFFEYCTAESFTEFRLKYRTDLEQTGNAYFEVIRDASGRIQQFIHLPSHQMRLAKQDDDTIEINRKILKMQEEDYSVIVDSVREIRRFRRFVQGRSINGRRNGFSSSSKLVWFKSFGDPRDLNKNTGEYALETGDDDAVFVKPEEKATEIIHSTIFCSRSPYGLPRYIGNLLSIFGDRAAEEINYTTFRNNNIPSMMILVSGGQLTDGTLKRLTSFAESQIQGSDNYSKFVVVEAETTADEGEDQGQARITVERMVKDQHNDALFQNYSEKNQDKIRRAFRLPPLLVGRCHSEDTEYLTENGWLLFDDIRDEVKLATFNQATGMIEYQAPSARHKHRHEGTLLHLKNRGIDAMITANHRMLTRPTQSASRAERDWEVVEASELKSLGSKGNGGCIEIPVSAQWSGERIETFTIPANESDGNHRDTWRPGGYIADSWDEKRKMKSWEKRKPREVSMDSFLKFLGFFISEGSTTEQPGAIRLSQNEGRVADEMIAVLEDLGFTPGVVRPTRRDGRELLIDISHAGLWRWLRENCGTHSENKRCPKWALNLAPAQIRILIDALVDGDGFRDPTGSEDSFNYSTTSKVLNDQFHEMCLKIGFACTSREVDRTEEKWKTLWCGSAHGDQRHLLKPSIQIMEVEYSGFVTCFTVPNGFLVTRRGGRALISGNSGDYTRTTAETSKRVADEQVFTPNRDEFDNLFNRIIYPDMGVRFHKFKSNTPSTTDNESLINILANAEKTGGVTPRIARKILEMVLSENLGEFPKGFDADVPFSMTMAEAVKNVGDPAEPGQQVTALKNAKTVKILKALLGDDIVPDSIPDGEEPGLFILKRMNEKIETKWQSEVSATDHEL